MMNDEENPRRQSSDVYPDAGRACPALVRTLTTPNTFEEISNEREALGWQNDPD